MAEDHDELFLKLRFGGDDAISTHKEPCLTYADMGRLLGLSAYKVHKRVE